ncbi:UNVERIFIED_ORG: type VI protein secretion system component VasK [Pantoea brenneri]|nr:type VI protein secretion system component VasK [Pantoea brenneri]
MDNINKPAAISVAATATVCIAVTTLLVLLGGVAWWLWATERSTEWDTLRPLIVSGFIVWGVALSMLVLGFMAFRLLIKDKVSPSSSRKRAPAKVTGHEVTYRLLKTHLRSRHSLFWRNKVRLLLITGDDAAIEQLIPGLKHHQWLEGNRTVLIYGGRLTAEPDMEKYTALRKLRRGRPLDGIVRVLSQSLTLTPRISDNDLRGLEKISELLRYSAPVWLWQLCDSKWSQAKRPEQTVGATFPLRAKPDDITRQLELMLPILRTQGVSQVAENNGHDFLLRLGQYLKDGGIVRWTEQLVPWLSGSQQRVPLRGLIFSLPENKPAETPEVEAAASANPEKYIPESQRHALTLPVTWQGIIDDCTRVRGRRVGMA